MSVLCINFFLRFQVEFTCNLDDSKCYAYVINFTCTFNITFPRFRFSDPSSPRSNDYSRISLFLATMSTNKKNLSYPSSFRYTRTQSLLTGCSQNVWSHQHINTLRINSIIVSCLPSLVCLSSFYFPRHIALSRSVLDSFVISSTPLARLKVQGQTVIPKKI